MRNFILAGIGLTVALAAITLSGVWSFSGRPVVDLFILAAIANLLFYIFIRTKKQLTSGLQVGLICGLAAIQAIGIICVRIDGTYGDGRPRFVWRWKPQPADVNIYDGPVATPTSIDVSRELVWSSFRGTDRTGELDTVQGINWESDALRNTWSKQIGGGWSSFAIGDGICITLEQRTEYETVVCYQLSTGNQIWKHGNMARFKEFTGGEGPRSTPTIIGDRVYSLGATGILNCLKLQTGELCWSRNILEANAIENCIFGMAGSPLVVQDLVLVTPGGKGSAIVAFNRHSGDAVWSAGNQTASYSSPQFANICDFKCVLNFNGEGLSCHDLRSNRSLFEIPWVSNPEEKNNVCQPVVFKNSDGSTNIFISSGYGQGSAVFEIRRTGEHFDVSKKWSNKLLKSKFSSVVTHNGHIYGLDNGILVCLNAQNGKRMWKQGRYGHGQIIRINDTLLIQAEKGYLALVACAPTEFREIKRIEALETRTWNHPACDGKYLLVRNDRKAICFELQHE